MKPTNELRFVERSSYNNIGNEIVLTKITNTLQQKWSTDIMNPMTGNYAVKEEWRDVPVEKEVV